jgi:hypothetical protein
MREPILTRRLLGLAEVTLVALAAALFSAFGGPLADGAREKARMTACMNNQRQIGLAILVYCQDNGEVLPRAETVFADLRLANLPTSTTLAALQGRMTVLTCPNAPALVNGYVYNSTIGGKALGDPTLGKMGDIQLQVTQIFLTADGQHTAAAGATPNVAFTLADFDTKRHLTNDGQTPCFIASFLDGHVDTTTADDAKDWLPK